MLNRWFHIIPLRIRSLFRREQVERELDRELRAHLELQTEENIRHGMTPSDARYHAVRQFGGVEQHKEDARDARGVALVENLSRDLRYTLRGLTRTPMLLLAATTSIALGVTGNIAVFSLGKDFFLTTPDVRLPEDVVQFRVSHGSHATYQRWLDLESSGALEHVAGFTIEKQINWMKGDATTSITPLLVTGNFFDVTGVPLLKGRAFTSNEARAELNPHVAVISYTFWQRELGGDPDVIGHELLLNGELYTVVGVLVPKLRTVVGLAIAPPVYLPLNRSLVPELQDRNAQVVQLIGRLKAGQTLSQGSAAVNAADKRLGRIAGDTIFSGVQEFTRVGTLGNTKQGRTIGAFMVLLGLISLSVLLIACANVAGLLIARSTARRREIAIRLAIGGTRARLVQQFLVEGFWLALIGTAAGLLLSLGFMRAVSALTLPIALPIELHLSPDVPVFLCALGLVVLSMFFCALLPALGATRATLTSALKRDETTYGSHRVTARGLLLAGQVMIATVLLVTAFLFTRSMMRSQLTHPGFDVDNVLVAQIGFVQGASLNANPLQLQQITEAIRSHPGVAQAAFASGVPLTMSGGSHSGRTARIDGRAERTHIEYAQSEIGPRYFGTLGIRLLRGREFAPADRPGTPMVVIVNEEFARRYVAEINAVGHHLQLLDDIASPTIEIVGVVANSKYATIGEELQPAVYFPLLQQPRRLSSGFVLVRASNSPAALLEPLKRAIAAMDRASAVTVEPMRTALAFALLPSRVGAVVLGSLGLLGLILATFGLYAIVSYNVSWRAREIAIRGALGATRGAIVRLVVSDASRLVSLGVIIGLAVAAAATQALTPYLVASLSATDPLSFGGTAFAFVIVTVFASWIPARQAVRVSPAAAMRLD